MTAAGLKVRREGDERIDEPLPRPRRRRRNDLLLGIAEHSLAILLTAVFLVPIVLIVLTAFMTSGQTLTSDLWPHQWQLSNFREVFVEAPFLTWLRNSLIYSVLATGFMLLSSFPAAYALARLQWRGRNLVLLAVITMMLLPPQVTVVPVYRMWAELGLTGTLWPLILPNLVGDAFSVFLLRQFLLTIPQEYSDAARVDGASELQIMLRVIVPMAKPAIAATTMFMFFFTWNDYFGPLLYTSDEPSHWTVAVGLASFRGLHHVQWNLVMAATVLVMLPVVVLFFFAQKAFVEGVTLTGVKG
jgi:multiple sugar transport system permease protein